MMMVILQVMLEDERVDPNQEGDKGETPLHVAAAKGQTCCALKLVFK
jgi:ankyrin repeat protein